MNADITGQEDKDTMEPTPSAEEQAQTDTQPTDDVTEVVQPEESLSIVDATPAEVAAEATEIVQGTDDESVDAGSTDDEPEAPSTAPAVESSVPFRRGDLVKGIITTTSPVEIIVALAGDHQGVIPGRELERMTRANLDELKEGMEVDVYVVNPNDHQGHIVLSVNRAMEELDWKRAEEYRASQDVYDGSVAGYNKGGLIVRFGRLRGFVPQSQISEDRRRAMAGETPEEMYGGMVNDTIVVKVMEVDRSRNRLILSERAASRERREKRKESLIEELEAGLITEGRVVSLEDFGAFVDIGGAEGLVHLTEISWKHITHPKEVLKVGQTVKVEVISVDRARKRIGLSIKRQEADPWDEVATTYQVGDLVKGTITKLTKFGAFAQLTNAEEIEGLIHISELSDQRVNHPKEVVNENEELTLRVVKIDVKNRRLGLSLKRVNSAEYLDRDLRTFASAQDDN